MKNRVFRALIAVIMLVALVWVLILVAACQPKITADAADAPDYTIRAVALSDDPEEELVIREITCHIIAYKADAVVLIRDKTTGEIKPLEIDIESFTPINIPIYQAHGNADRVEFFCTMWGTRGDSLDCEVTDSKGHMAPLVDSIDFQLINRGEKGMRLPANCLGTISVQA